MKKIFGILALATASVFAQPVVTIYGNLDQSVYHTSQNSKSVTTMNSNGNSTSLWGIKGSENLGNGTKVGFDLKSELTLVTGQTGSTSTGVTSTDSNKSTVFNRGAFVQAENDKLGTVQLGRQNDVWWETQAQLNNSGSNSFGFGNATAAQSSTSAAGYKALNGAGNTGLTYLGQSSAGNTNAGYFGVAQAFIAGISYATPTVYGIQAKVQTSAGKVGYNNGEAQDAGGGYSLSFKQGPVKLLYGHNYRNDTNGDTAWTQSVVGGTYTYGQYTFIAAQNKTKFRALSSSLNDMTARGYGVNYVVNPTVDVNVSYTTLKDDEASANKFTQKAVTGRYKFSKTTQVYAGVGVGKNEGLSTMTPIYGGVLADTAGRSTRAFLTGLRVQF